MYKEKNQFSLHSNYIFRMNEVICTLVKLISPEMHFRLLFNRFSGIHQAVRLPGSQEQFPITTEHKIYIITAHRQYSKHTFQCLWIVLFRRIGQECKNWLCLDNHTSLLSWPWGKEVCYPAIYRSILRKDNQCLHICIYLCV